MRRAAQGNAAGTAGDVFAGVFTGWVDGVGVREARGVPVSDLWILVAAGCAETGVRGGNIAGCGGAGAALAGRAIIRVCEGGLGRTTTPPAATLGFPTALKVF